MLHLPKKHPWLILIGIYAVIILVWGIFMFLAKQTGKQHLNAEEAEQFYKENKPTHP